MSKEQLNHDFSSTGEIHQLRQDYSRGTLSKKDVAKCPFDQFRKWFEQAHNAGVVEPNAMVLATVDTDGSPSTRTVLLKGLENGIFVFFSNYESRKGRELANNPRAGITFLWKELERQVCIRGTVEKTSREESQRYFHSRPHGSQIGAMASTQSSIVPNRKYLEMRYEELTTQYPEGGAPVPPPDNWGGFRLSPTAIEFWQGRPSRLHDRILYSLSTNDSWQIVRLSP